MALAVRMLHLEQLGQLDAWTGHAGDGDHGIEEAAAEAAPDAHETLVGFEREAVRLAGHVVAAGAQARG